jgi:hypothetical protein
LHPPIAKGAIAIVENIVFIGVDFHYFLLNLHKNTQQKKYNASLIYLKK